jgi:hypothetical protein
MPVKVAQLMMNWNRLLDLSQDSQELSKYLKSLVRDSEFHLSDETQWAYAKVATFLEDGWTSQQGYTTLRVECALTLDQFGFVANTLLAGSRYDQSEAELVGARWLGCGEWPTDRDRAALLFFTACAVPE